MPSNGPPRPPAPPAPGESHEHEPPVVEVTVDALGDREVEVRLADGRTGVMPREDFERARPPSDEGWGEPGSVVRVAVLARDDPRGRVALSAAWAAKADAWRRIEDAQRERRELSGPVVRSVKGGWVVDLGVRAFLPRSLVGEGPEAGADLTGTEVDVLVHELDRRADRLVVSRRDALKRRRRTEEKAAWSSLEEGQRRTGRVVAVQDYGAKVAIGPLQGLVHRSEVSWSHIEHPSDVVAVGDEVEVVVLDVSRSRKRIGLSLRRAVAHPFDSVEVGEVYDATVLRVVDYGAFVRLEPSGAEGLAHVSELTEIPGSRADQLVVPGEQLRVTALSVDRERNRLAVSALRAAMG